MIYLASLTEGIEDKVQGYYIIKTKEQLDRVVADNVQNNKVIIKRDFAREYFTPTGLDRYIANTKKINRNLIIEIDEASEVLTHGRLIEKIKKAFNAEELLSLLATYPSEFLDAIKYLTREDGLRAKELLDASSNVSRLQSTIDELRLENENLRHTLEVEQSNKLYTQSKLDVLINRINYQFNAGVDQSKLFTVKENSFDKVIYIKEITRVQYTDSFVYYLKEILKVLYSMPTRLVVVEGYYASGKERLYPDLVAHNKLSENDVLAGDILMLGMQPKVMEDILKNPSNVSILIVLDRGGFGANHIKGDNVEYLYTASDPKDIPDTVPKSRIISYDESTLFIPYIENFELLDKGEKISKYSSTEIIKRVVSLIEGR